MEMPIDEPLGKNAQLALDTINMKPTAGICSAGPHVMDVAFIEQFTSLSPGDYRRDPDASYVAFMQRMGACFVDQYLAKNPLTMGNQGYEADATRGATTGAEEIVCDGIVIDGPEAVARHMEEFALPKLEKQLADHFPDVDQGVARRITSERDYQRRFGPNMLKVPYDGFVFLPRLRYEQYGYIAFFQAYALYPELMERDFSLQADVSIHMNKICARAITEGHLPRFVRLDHDMADDRGTIVSMASLERVWFPHFARGLQPLLDAGVRLIWHCDGNLMAMVPRLIEVGISGFQGFQYECGMDYEKICRMTDRHGEPLFIWAGVSVTRTLPFGTAAQVRDEIKWLVENGPPRGLVLGASSSVAPGTPHENIRALIEGLKYYREHGRG